MNPLFGCGAFQRYTFGNDRRWKYVWIADKRYVTGSAWLPYKGPYALTPPSGTTFPTWSLGWGTGGKYGKLTFNGTSDMLSVSGPEQVAQSFSPCSVIGAYKLLGTVVGLMQIWGFSANSDTQSTIVFQTSPSPSPTFPFRAAVIPDVGGGSSVVANNSDNNRHVTGIAFGRVPSGTLYQGTSGTVDGASVSLANTATSNYSTQNLSLLRFVVGGFWGATKLFTNVEIRGIAIADTEMSNPTGTLLAAPTDPHIATSSYLSKELV